MPRTCTNHCRRCGAHFTSLEAFDRHHTGSGEGLISCTFPDGAGLVEVAGGVCKISDPTQPQLGVTLYEHERAARLREHFSAREAA